MQILDRYLTAVKFWLPKKQRADIAAELAANLQAEVDDRAAAQGRPLQPDELAALLKEHGAPIVVASRYRSESRTLTFGRQLIGPLLFPFYCTALKVTLVLLLVPGVIPAFVLNFNDHPGEALRNALARVAQISLPVLLLVTIVFALLDLFVRKYRLLERWTERWDPRRLPAPKQRLVPRANSVAGIIVQSIFILWWLGHSAVPVLEVSDHAMQIQFATIIGSLHLPILIIAFICLAQHWVNLAEPGWYLLPPATGLATSLAGLIILYPLFRVPDLLVLTNANGLPVSGADAVALHKITYLCLFSLWIGLIITGAVFAGRLVWIGCQLLPRERNGASTKRVLHG